jgi:hypothetical protein
VCCWSGDASNDLASGDGMADWRRHTIDVNCPRFSESPTNIIRLSRSVSSICVALNLRTMIAPKPNTSDLQITCSCKRTQRMLQPEE